MTAVRRFHVALLSTLALLFSGVANVHAHVHLCLDGQEPPAAMQFDDSHGHGPDHHVDRHVDHHVDSTGSHQDVDVDVPAQASTQSTPQSIAKTLKVELPSLGPVASGHAFAPLWVASGTIPDADDVFSPPPLPHWRPPLRGPPR